MPRWLIKVLPQIAVGDVLAFVGRVLFPDRNARELCDAVTAVASTARMKE